MPKVNIKQMEKTSVLENSITKMIEAKANKRLAAKKNALANGFNDVKMMQYEPLTPLELTPSQITSSRFRYTDSAGMKGIIPRKLSLPKKNVHSVVSDVRLANSGLQTTSF